MAGAIPPLPPFEDAAAARFYELLRGRRLAFPRCDGCARTFVPPRARCPRCFSVELSWIDAPTRGTLYAFTRQPFGLRFVKPEVIGIVELQLDGPARLLTRIDAPFAELAVGMPVALDFLEPEPGVVLHQFRPVKTTASPP